MSCHALPNQTMPCLAAPRRATRGDRGIRTPNPLLAKQLLYQLELCPQCDCSGTRSRHGLKDPSWIGGKTMGYPARNVYLSTSNFVPGTRCRFVDCDWT